MGIKAAWAMGIVIVARARHGGDGHRQRVRPDPEC